MGIEVKIKQSVEDSLRDFKQAKTELMFCESVLKERCRSCNPRQIPRKGHKCVCYIQDLLDKISKAVE